MMYVEFTKFVRHSKIVLVKFTELVIFFEKLLMLNIQNLIFSLKNCVH